MAHCSRSIRLSQGSLPRWQHRKVKHLARAEWRGIIWAFLDRDDLVLIVFCTCLSVCGGQICSAESISQLNLSWSVGMCWKNAGESEEYRHCVITPPIYYTHILLYWINKVSSIHQGSLLQTWPPMTTMERDKHRPSPVAACCLCSPLFTAGLLSHFLWEQETCQMYQVPYWTTLETRLKPVLQSLVRTHLSWIVPHFNTGKAKTRTTTYATVYVVYTLYVCLYRHTYMHISTILFSFSLNFILCLF